MKKFLSSIYYQIIIFTRVKIAVFFSFVFPIFLFVVFSLIWGYNNPYYSKFLLTGVIVMKVTSDALFSIGSVIVKYYEEGFVKFFEGLPYSFIKYIGALITGRILTTIITSALLLLVGVLFFHVKFQTLELLYVLLGIIGGFIIFSFLGLIISIFTADREGAQSTSFFVYFVMIFLSNLFYPLSDLNPTLGKIAAVLPVGPVISLTRGDVKSGLFVILWSIVFIAIFYISFIKYKAGWQR